ncbi:Fanconi anemia core complex-associated protein 100 [Rana temporaria]|uniref:Fanconi anemia core complex-associated protein 100 n=1 Tax=Rana temporaria TaxID=8407 RepID=UPI001AACE4FE|nr:Fanconi anemia core complex-associated protein 100 [Rana temporaria]XP_040186885.1 Fanconi anemia core complex-associated protein 100 [Rana temporaria]
MAGVEQLAQLQCPAGGVPGGKGRIVPWGSDLYVCGGSEFLHVFSLERRTITAVYLFPSKISHMQADRENHQLYALCALCGVFLLEWDETGSRLLQEPDCTSQRGGVTVHHIGPGFCCLRDGGASSFTLAGDVLVLAVQQSEEWKVRVFPRKSLGYGDPNPSPTREVTLSGKAVTPSPSLQPVLCCVSLWKEDKVNGVPSAFLLEARLFTRLFGVDLAMLDSPIILCGFPDGRVAYFPLKSSGSCGENRSSLKLLYHMEQPVVSVGATKTGPRDGGTEQPIGGFQNVSCDCVLLIGQKGSLVSVTSGEEGEGAACEYRKYPVHAPVCCAFYSTAAVIYSNPSDLFSITIPKAEDGPRGSVVSSVRHNVPRIATVSENIHTSDGTGLVLLSSRGRLMLRKFNQKGHGGQRPGPGGDNTGLRIKELLSGIGSVSDRVSRLKSSVGEKSRALQKLNQVMSLSRQLLSCDWRSSPLRCDVKTRWTRMLQTDCMAVSCTLENGTDCVLEGGWTLCVLISSDTSYSFPLTSLKPGERTERTFPLPAHTYRSLHFPIDITFTLFYHLEGLIRDSGLSADPSPARHGVCIPLWGHSVDLLRCLRFGPQISHPESLHTMPEDVARVFIKASSAGIKDERSAATDTQGDGNSAPLKARLQISASLLAQALQNGKSGSPLCLAVLHWLLSMDTVKEQSLAEVQGVTPDGKDFSLQVQEISVSDVAAAGSVPAIEIQILSSHLHVVAALHLAVISHFQSLLQQNQNGGHTPDLDLGKIQQQFMAQEPLLKELRTLKERLNVDEEIISRTAAERLLHIYRELRDPGLLFI